MRDKRDWFFDDDDLFENDLSFENAYKDYLRNKANNKFCDFYLNPDNIPCQNHDVPFEAEEEDSTTVQKDVSEEDPPLEETSPPASDFAALSKQLDSLASEQVKIQKQLKKLSANRCGSIPFIRGVGLAMIFLPPIFLLLWADIRTAMWIVRYLQDVPISILFSGIACMIIGLIILLYNKSIHKWLKKYLL